VGPRRRERSVGEYAHAPAGLVDDDKVTAPTTDHRPQRITDQHVDAQHSTGLLIASVTGR
jgi:hypothetical protein